MEIEYKPTFIKQYACFESSLKEEIKEKIELFKDKKNHKQLKVHKLKGKLSKYCSFSVNYKYRIVFVYQSKSRATLLAIGDHDVYR
jgi:plasmid maintenance system killer protein